MERLVDWLLTSELIRMLSVAFLGAFVGYLVSELTRIRRKKRLLVESARLPQFVLTIKEHEVSLRMIGSYGIVNMSELPISLRRPHLLGYNLASRAFQFTVRPIYSASDKVFEEFTILPNSEMVLISQESCNVDIERFKTRSIPALLWLETLEYIRLGSRNVFRWRARLYVVKFYLAEQGETWYRPTEVEISSTKARLLALPGKLFFRYKEKHVSPTRMCRPW